jgi:hypothetical protein
LAKKNPKRKAVLRQRMQKIAVLISFTFPSNSELPQ